MGSPRIFNPWGEEEARLPLNERSLLIVASRFRRDARVNRALAAKNERRRPKGRLQSFLLHARVLLHGLRADSGAVLRAVAHLRVRRRRRDGPPRLTGGHAQRYGTTGQ